MNKSYFDHDVLGQKIAMLKKNKDCYAWLPEALQEIGNKVQTVPVPADTNKYVAEFIYPH